MSNFVKFFAEGIIYSRDKNGRPNGVKDTRFGRGVTFNGPELMGKVFRQCPDLLPCDNVTIRTSPIG